MKTKYMGSIETMKRQKKRDAFVRKFIFYSIIYIIGYLLTFTAYFYLFDCRKFPKEKKNVVIISIFWPVTLPLIILAAPSETEGYY